MTNQYQDLKNFKLPKKFRGRSAIIVQTWWITQRILFNLSPQIFYGWRNFLLRLFGADIGEKARLRPSVRITYPWNLTIGDHSWIGDHVTLYTLGEIAIGSNTVISQKCYLATGSHDYQRQTFDIYTKRISIGDGVWLASDVFVFPGITIGDGAVVGARSTVIDDLPEGVICFGNPAKPVKQRQMKVD
jgi:putative colanic acid biosynthesis acetyltransferase WcaF